MTLPIRRRLALVSLAALSLLAAGCGSDSDDASSSDDASAQEAEYSGTLRLGAIPDQDPEKLTRTYGLVADYLEEAVPGIDVEYVPVTDYSGAVSSFASGDLDLVWFGGLTGVQARQEVEGAQALAQRDIDAEFTSVFIANESAGIEPFDSVEGLTVIEGSSLTFGSESSTSGRLMPQYFLEEAGVDVETDLEGEVGFSGAHDATIELVAAGTYETGALNSQVWDSAVAEGTVDEATVVEVFRTPTYYDYHWVVQPDLDDTLGEGATDAVLAALLALDADVAEEAEILELFGADAFIETDAANYAAIEEVGRTIGVIR